MSVNITDQMVKMYSDNVSLLVQQEGSRLRNAVRLETGKVGEEYYMDRLKKTSAQLITARHADTPLIDTIHDRRRVTPLDYDWGDLIDTTDVLRVLADPQSMYVRNGAAAMSRAMDQVIIDAAFADVSVGKAAGSTCSWPASSIASDGNPETAAVSNGGVAGLVRVNNTPYGGDNTANTSMTVDKLIAARKILMENEALHYNEGQDPNLFIVCTADEIASLLKTTQVGSVDYNSVRALVEGRVDTFMGFRFIQSELVNTRTLSTVNSETPTINRCIAFHRDGLGLCVWRDITGRSDPRPDKRYANQLYLTMTIGSVRLEEDRIVEIECKQDA